VLFGSFVVGLGVSITLSETALTLLTLVWLWRLRDPAIRASAQWPLWQPVLAFSAATLLSAVLSPSVGSSLVASKGLLLMAALYVTVDALPGAEEAQQFVSALVAVVAIAATVGLLQAGLCPGPQPDYGWPRWLYHRCARARGFFSIYMTLAGVLTLVLLLGLPLVIHARRMTRWLLLPWVTALVGLAATYTRGAWLGFAAGVATLLPMTRRGRWLLVAGLVIVGLVVFAGSQTLRQRLLTMGDPDDATLRERIFMWRSGLTMWQEHPWLGVGPGGVKREYASYALPEAVKKRTGHVHCTPLQILVERGVLGLAAWLAIWVAFYVRAIRLLRRLPSEAQLERALVVGSLAAITGFLIGGLSEYNFGDSEVVMVAWASMALPWVVKEKGQAPHPDPLPFGERGSR
ncbi:MAG: O-antigen ligase family protein, partial [Candidatus Rokuibacteriota bacterium]